MKTAPVLAAFGISLLAPAWAAGAPGPSAPLEVSGSVVEAGGQVPQPGAVAVALLPLPSNYAWRRGLLAGRGAPEPVATAQVGGDGRFRVTAPAVGMWSVVVTAPSGVPMRYLPLPLTDSIELPPVSLPRDAGVEVVVRERDGEPAAGTWVLATTTSLELWQALRVDGWQADSRLERTDADGRVRLPRIAGEALEIHAFAPGGGARAVAAVAGDAARTVLILEPTASGPVLEVRDSGALVADAVVSVGSPAWPAGTTGRDGRLALPVNGTGPLELLLADGRRYRLESLPSPHAPAGAGVGEPERIDLAAMPRLAGKVLDGATRRPLRGALVWPGDDPGNVTSTDDRGVYTVPSRAGGRAWVQVEARGFRPRAVTLPPAGDPAPVPTLALEPAVTLAGRVVDAAGAPLAGAVITVAPEGRELYEVFDLDRAAGRAASDGDGRFLLRGLGPAATYGLVASRPGYRAARSTAAADGVIRLVLERARSAHGVAVDSQERPLAGVEVTIRSAAAPGESVTAVTDGLGRFEVPALPADRVDLEARRAGFAPMRVPGVAIVRGSGSADLGVLVLAPGVRVEGRVADAAGRPLSEVEVWWAEADRPPSRTLAGTLRPRTPAAVSDEDGRFAIADLTAGRPVNVLLARPGYLPAWVAGVEAPSAEPVRVVLERASGLHGRVEDEAGEPVPGARVRLRSAGPPPGTVGVEPRRAENAADLRADRDGAFTFAEIAPGGVTLEAWAEGFLPLEPVELQVPPNEEVRDVRLILDRGASVSGWIATPGGEPVAGAGIRIGSARSESDAEGRYQMSGVPLGLQALVLSHPAYLRKLQEVDVQAGVNRVDLVVEKGTTVSGRVIDEAGSPKLGVTVTLSNRGDRGPRSYRASTGAEGRFELLAVVDSRFDLEADAAGFAPSIYPGGVEVAGRDVDGLEVVLRVGATLFGRIRGLGLDQMTATEVTAERAGRPPRPGTVDYDGRFEIRELEAGDWHLRARLAGGRREAETWVVIAPGDHEVERDLELGGGLALDGLVLVEGRPLPRSPVGLRGLDVTVERGVTTDYRGRFRIEDLEPGGYRVEVVDAERMLSHSEDLELVADREIVIELTPAVLSGTVVAADSGAGLAEALVHLQRLLGGAEPGPLTTVGTDAAGSFVTASLAPGRYRVTARADGHAPAERTVDVAAGVLAEPLTIELAPTGGLAITVRRALGVPPGGVTVVALDGSGRPVHVEEPVLSDYGHGYLRQVPPGDWTLLVKAAGSATALARATVPGERLEVTLPRGATLTVRVPALLESRVAAALHLVATDGARYFDVEPGGGFRRAWPVIGGAVVVPDLPAGAWRLEVTATDGRVWTASALTTGDTAAIVVID